MCDLATWGTPPRICSLRCSDVSSAVNWVISRAARRRGDFHCVNPVTVQAGIAGLKFQPAGFYKDRGGLVHLRGTVAAVKKRKPLKGLIFTLPPGDRPANGVIEVFPVSETNNIFVFGSKVTLGVTTSKET